MSKDQIPQIAARVEKATPGPWVIHSPRGYKNHIKTADGLYVMEENAYGWRHREDAEFCAHAREDVPYLLNELRASESARQEAERERDEYWDDLCEVKAGTGVVPQALYDVAWERVKKAEADRDALRAQLTALEAKWRQTGLNYDTFHATMGVGYKACAEEVAQILKGQPTYGEQTIKAR
jgi:hypothetical protein